MKKRKGGVIGKVDPDPINYPEMSEKYNERMRKRERERQQKAEVDE